MLRTPMLRASVVFFLLACISGVIAYWYGDMLHPGTMASLAAVAFIVLMVMALLTFSISMIPPDNRNRTRMYG